MTSNKVLTASYSVFSCTFEGFEDSFEMMRAVAGYFRELAAEDRHFGSVHPKMDERALAMSAQKAGTKAIESKTDGNSVVLRPSVTNVASPLERDTVNETVTSDRQDQIIDDSKPRLSGEPMVEDDSITKAEAFKAAQAASKAKQVADEKAKAEAEEKAKAEAKTNRSNFDPETAAEKFARMNAAASESAPHPAQVFTEDERANDVTDLETGDYSAQDQGKCAA